MRVIYETVQLFSECQIFNTNSSYGSMHHCRDSPENYFEIILLQIITKLVKTFCSTFLSLRAAKGSEKMGF